MKCIKLLPLILLFLFSCENKKEYFFNEGFIFGTIYHISYQADADLHDIIKAKMIEFDLSLSTYKKTSVISRVNNNDSTVVLDKYFLSLISRSQQISERTSGAFDITVAPLVNAWGFGFGGQKNPDDINVDSLLQITGYNKISLVGNKLIKQDERIMLDASAIAKGYGVDVVAQLLQSKGVDNFMVEIGGEIRVLGMSVKNRAWRLGIDQPIEDAGIEKRKIQNIVKLSQGALATSGNYRQFYIKNGKKYAHTISPFTGHPVQHSLLSSTVIAPDCMTADAYATAFMVLGLEKSVEIVKNNPDLDAFFIFTNNDGKYETYSSPKMKLLLVK